MLLPVPVSPCTRLSKCKLQFLFIWPIKAHSGNTYIISTKPNSSPSSPLPVSPTAAMRSRQQSHLSSPSLKPVCVGAIPTAFEPCVLAGQSSEPLRPPLACSMPEAPGQGQTITRRRGPVQKRWMYFASSFSPPASG